jgi:hypothetical protein
MDARVLTPTAFVLVLISAVALVLTGPALGARASHTPAPWRIDGRVVPEWKWALVVRSRALDKRYRLGRWSEGRPPQIKPS